MDKNISQPSSLHKGKITALTTGLLFSSLTILIQTTKTATGM